ncbi:heterokaryon incompatibility protein-domain-containing protein [Biscogniauxia marginata]|nr:heterokaryon incompatibility protein-domain-containing protein [Biscogniauxia marginata]
MATRLCRACKRLQFDDTTVSRLERHSDDGTSYLFSVDQEPERHLKTEYEFQDTFPLLPRLEQSARDGCDCCRFLRETIQHAPITPPIPVARVMLYAWYIWKEIPKEEEFSDYQGLRGLLLQVRFSHPNGRPIREPLPFSTVVFDIYSDSEPCATWLRMEPAPSLEVLGTKNVRWLQDRLQKHIVSTRRVKGEKFLPTRLVDLGSEQQGIPPRLVLSRDIQHPGSDDELKYAALSYCWGSPAETKFQLKTERGTIAERLASIDTNSMTLVVKDAVRVCNALGIRYLWVDAICIVQDDRSDWDRESQRIDRIFNNAVVTICPSSSSSCQQGFLTRPRHSIDIQFNSRVKLSVSGHYTMEYSMLDPDSLETHGVPVISDLRGSVWDSRAWTFQEFHSSQLVMLFGRQKIHVINIDGVASEGRNEPVRQEGVPMIPVMDRRLSSRTIRFNTKKYIYSVWMELLPRYNERQLTDATDKFPTLSGLASYFRRILKNESYVAGLWMRDLFRQLFWSDVKGHGCHTLDKLVKYFRSPQFCVAPSWSWARHNNYFEFGFYKLHLTYPGTYYRPGFTKIQPSITLSGTNPFGQINSALLTIVSRVLPLRYVPQRFYHDHFSVPLWKVNNDRGQHMAYCSLDWTESDVVVSRPLYLVLLGSLRKEECMDHDDVGENDKEEDEDEDEEEEQYTDEEEDEEGDDEEDDEEDDGEDDGEDEYENNDDGRSGNGRIAWGLIICDAEDGDSQVSEERKYYRVGVFYSYPKGRGGLKLFDKCETKTVCLI